MKLTRDIVVAIVELPFMTFHASVVLFLCIQRRKDPLICSAFFTMYIIVSIADMTTIIVFLIK
ncbi:hypothetical protein AAVH_24885 [Aphelenchoides avenae]|nr:hypothetical protein AAVH_24885 [Aphelenchus avenae]